MDYKKGQMITCPHCSCDAIVQEKTEMDGWTKLGQCLACNICGEKLADIKAAENKATETTSDNGKDAFADFLGTSASSDRDENFLGDVSDRKFCRDCKNFAENPFYTRCMLHEKDVAPMDDCPDFTARED